MRNFFVCRVLQRFSGEKFIQNPRWSKVVNPAYVGDIMVGIIGKIKYQKAKCKNTYQNAKSEC